MKRAAILVLALIGLVAAGCDKSEVTEGDAAKVKEEFSQENYEKAMIAAGKGKELEEEKKRNAEYLQQNSSGGQG